MPTITTTTTTITKQRSFRSMNCVHKKHKWHSEIEKCPLAQLPQTTWRVGSTGYAVIDYCYDVMPRNVAILLPSLLLLQSCVGIATTLRWHCDIFALAHRPTVALQAACRRVIFVYIWLYNKWPTIANLKQICKYFAILPQCNANGVCFILFFCVFFFFCLKTWKIPDRVCGVNYDRSSTEITHGCCRRRY